MAAASVASQSVIVLWRSARPRERLLAGQHADAPAAPSSTATSTRCRTSTSRPGADPGVRAPLLVRATADESKGLHPWDGVTEPGLRARAQTPRAPAPTSRRFDEGGEVLLDQGAPLARSRRWRSGPLARYADRLRQGAARGDHGADRQSRAQDARRARSEALFSTLGRTAARARRGTVGSAQDAATSYDKLIANVKAGDLGDRQRHQLVDPKTWPKDGQGRRASPRHRAGALGATGSRSRTRKIDQLPVRSCRQPGTAAPRDEQGQYRRLRGFAS